MNEKNIIELYRNQVENLKANPPETCWDEISTQLDIEETWDSVSMELDNVLPLNNAFKKTSADSNLFIFTRAAILISPLVLILLLMLSDNRTPGFYPSAISETAVNIDSAGQPVIIRNNEKAIPESELTVKETKAVSWPIYTQEPKNAESGNLLPQPRKIYAEETIPVNVSSTPEPEIEFPAITISQGNATVAIADGNISINVDPVVLPPGQPILRSVVLMPYTIVKPISGTREVTSNKSTGNTLLLTGRKIRMNRFSGGISITEKNTWLISQETFDGFDRQELNTTKAKFINDFGIILRYTLSERWSFEGSSFLLSKTGQSYKQYLNGIYSTKIYELKYTSFEMSARYAMRKILNINNLKSYSVAGGYISHLSSAHETINRSLNDISPDYDPVDYGIVLGYEVEIAIINRFAVTPGVRIKYGIPNIFADQPGNPDELHTTRNASLEFRLNLMLPLAKY
jgi:hypothetical protein